MATRIESKTFDDLTGEEGAKPVTFALGTRQYSIDMSQASLERLNAALEPFIEVALPTGKRLVPAHTRTRGAGHAGMVRAWAAENGIHVGVKGRIPADVFEKYNAVH
jgi:hypothetical protein